MQMKPNALSWLLHSVVPLCALATGSAQANPLMWSNNSLSYLYGHGYKVDGTGNDIQQTITFEHASGWTWGDMFLFVDNKLSLIHI